MTTSPRRHQTITINCEYCGNQFDALVSLLKKGKGKYCSRSCANKGRTASNIGYENAVVAFDKGKQSYYVYWIDYETRKRKTTTYARWWWIMNKGEIPDGYRAGYRDGNPLNIDPSNICLQSPEEFGGKISQRLQGHGFSDDTLAKMSARKKGGKLKDEHKKKIGDNTRAQWNSGRFDDVHVGENHRLWRGGTRPYPSEFDTKLRAYIKERDRHTCQSCGKSVYRSRFGHVHHIDGNKQNNDERNLVLLCSQCHSLVHLSEADANDFILYLRSQLH